MNAQLIESSPVEPLVVGVNLFPGDTWFREVRVVSTTSQQPVDLSAWAFTARLGEGVGAVDASRAAEGILSVTFAPSVTASAKRGTQLTIVGMLDGGRRTFVVGRVGAEVGSSIPVGLVQRKRVVSTDVDISVYAAMRGDKGEDGTAISQALVEKVETDRAAAGTSAFNAGASAAAAQSSEEAAQRAEERAVEKAEQARVYAAGTVALQDAAVTGLVSGASATRQAILGEINTAVNHVGSNDRSFDAVIAGLDMREVRPFVIASAGDSTASPFATGAFMRTWKELAASVWPDRPFRVFAWGKESNAYPSSPTTWQDAAIAADPGGDTPNSLIAADSFSLNGGDMANRPAEVGAASWSSTAGAFTVADGVCIANPAYAGGGIPGVTLPALARVGGDFDYRGEWRVSSQDSTGVQRRIRAAVNGANGEIRVQATGSTVVTATVTKIIGGVTTTLGTFPAGTIPNNTAAAWYSFQIRLVGVTLTLTLNGQTLTYTLEAGDAASLGGTFGMADNSRNAGIRAFEVRGTVTRPPVAGGPSPLGWATVYNAAVAGSTIAYQRERIAAMYPVQPDVIFIHHGHNYASGTTTPSQFFEAVDGFLSALFTAWAPCPVVIASQNPEVVAGQVDAARVARHLAIQRTIRAEAQRRGWGYVPIFEAFAARPDGGASLIQPDGIHPVIGSGTNLQTETQKAWVRRRSMRP